MIWISFRYSLLQNILYYWYAILQSHFKRLCFILSLLMRPLGFCTQAGMSEIAIREKMNFFYILYLTKNLVQSHVFVL